MKGWWTAALTVAAALCPAWGQSPDQVLVVVNDASALSRSAAEYYARKRAIPAANICRIRARTDEVIGRDEYARTIAGPVGAFLTRFKLRDRIVYVATTAGVPLRIEGSGGMGGDTASVDSELTLLYSDLGGQPHRVEGVVPNPMFRRMDAPRFSPSEFPIYLVTRLAGYDFADIRGMIDRSSEARDRGKFVLDLKDTGSLDGDDWLLAASDRLPNGRVVIDKTSRILYDQTDVIGYASWGSNDPNRKRRHLGFRWLPGAVATEFVSTNARTIARPPEDWAFGSWKEKLTWFGGSPQSLAADLIHDGATAATGHVFEPYLGFTPRPEYLLPAYQRGRTLAESFYLSIPALSWQNVVLGDPIGVLRR